MLISLGIKSFQFEFLSLSLSVCLSLSVTVSVCLSLSVYACLCLCLSVSVCVFLSLSVCLGLSDCAYLCLSLSLSVCASLSLSLLLLSCCLTSTEARWPIRDGDRVGRGRESERLDRGNRPKKTGETVVAVLAFLRSLHHSLLMGSFVSKFCSRS